MPSEVPNNMQSLAELTVASDKVVGGLSDFTKVKVEANGRGFFEAYEKLDDGEYSEHMSELAKGDETPSSTATGDNSPGKMRQGAKKGGVTGILKLDENMKDLDLYELMEVSEEATKAEIMEDYKKIQIKYHPDKAAYNFPDMSEKEVNDQFVMVQTAYEILTDTQKRNKYDSSRPFDDAIPSEKDAQALPEGDVAAFHKLFASTIHRNGKWSIRQPFPELPDETETDIKVVQNFFKFWTNFDSWRDFDVMIQKEDGEDALDDVDKADSREERRYMERKNELKRRKRRDAEFKRILTLVERAEKYDPRIIQYKEEQFNKKNAGKL